MHVTYFVKILIAILSKMHVVFFFFKGKDYTAYINKNCLNQLVIQDKLVVEHVPSKLQNLKYVKHI